MGDGDRGVVRMCILYLFLKKDNLSYTMSEGRVCISTAERAVKSRSSSLTLYRPLRSVVAGAAVAVYV